MDEVVEMKSPFKGLKDKVVELKVGEDIVKAKPIVADVEAFITLKKEMTEEDAKKVSQILVDMIARANPEEDREDIAAYIARHYGDILMQASLVFGFATPDQIRATKKKLMQ